MTGTAEYHRQITIGKNFEYTVAGIEEGIARAQYQLDAYRRHAESPDPVLRELAPSGIETYQHVLDYAQTHTPQEMLTELQNMFDDLRSLEDQHAPDEQVENMLFEKYREQVSVYTALLDGGWVAGTIQALATKKLRD